MKVCRECGVPYAVSKEHVWSENGVITQAKDPDHRMVFYESDNLDSLFQGIEDIIGLPIEHIVIESKRREVKEYVENLLSPLARKVARYVGMGAMIRKLSRIGKAFGYGNVRLSDRRVRFDDDDYVSMVISNPHSILFYCGENLGAWEAIDGRQSRVKYEELMENTFEVTNYIGEHAIELSERLVSRAYRLKPGDIHFDRCDKCGVPLEVARCRWNLELGTIIDPNSGRRMAIFGPAGFEAITDDLEVELGETIPEAVIEAQRRYTKQILSAEALPGDNAGFRGMLSMRGLGNLVQLEFDEEGAAAVIENSCMHLLMVGLIQGIFEVLFGYDKSAYEWGLKDDGDLNVGIKRI
jgi:hypothetical protein